MEKKAVCNSILRGGIVTRQFKKKVYRGRGNKDFGDLDQNSSLLTNNFDKKEHSAQDLF